VLLLSAFGLASGVSVLADGFYDVTVWGPITIGVAAVALALAVIVSARPRLVPALAVAGLTSLWLWSWLSSTWAESRDQALVSAGRWALYAGMLAALLLLMRTRRDRWLPLAFAGIGIVAVGLSLVLHMRTGGGETFFFGGRLRDPLGYVNGQAGYFLLGFWPCVSLAEQTRSKLLAGVGAAAAVVLGSLLILSETRGVIPAVVVSAVVILLVVPGRARRVWALVVIGIALAAIGQPLLDIYRELPKGSQADPEMVRRAGQQILLAAAAAGVVWAVAQTVLGLLGGEGRDRAVHLVEGALAAAAVVVAVGGAAVAVGDPVHKIRQQYDDFVNLRVDQDAGSTRFLSGGGYRYDYWRVAWLEFQREPLHGEGAGNYDRHYFVKRRTSEDIKQPHSLPLQVLAELGVVGALALALFLGAVLGGLWRQSRRGVQSWQRRMIAVAAGGAFVAWLAHTSVDWLHIIPGVTGVALCAAAALLAPWSRRAPSGGLRPVRVIAAVLVGVAAIAAADSVGRLALAEHDRIQARDTLRSDPVEALRLTNDSLALNGDSVPALQAQSAAYARLGEYGKARAALRRAVRLEPHDHLPWALLGDLTVRRGNLRAARRYYRRASRLNPKSDTIKQLVKDPGSALPRGG
jgi:hypothetical protein